VIWVLRDKNLESRIGLCELFFTPPSFGKQKISIGAGWSIRVMRNQLFVFLRALCAG
jgi:hypothetical protein